VIPSIRPADAPDDADDLPAVHVNWHDAQAYCDWLRDRTGRAYRLPAEAEWEFACRAGSRTPFSCGDEITPAAANFLLDEYGARIGLGHRTAVGSHPPNQFGLYDLHGNVCEWVGTLAPQLPWRACRRYSLDPAEDGRHVVRGGAWITCHACCAARGAIGVRGLPRGQPRFRVAAVTA